jgi:hypothetical protein
MSALRFSICSGALALGGAALFACAEGDSIPTGAGGTGAGTESTAADTRGEGGGIGPGAGGNDACSSIIETCDGADNNCDGEIDEGCDCAQGEMQPCFTGEPMLVGVGVCAEGTQLCDGTGKWGPCEGEVLPSQETCDGDDDDCDGAVDNGFEPETCGMGACTNTVETCVDGVPQTCAPLQPPDPTEDCEGSDDDCDGMVDEGCTCVNGSTQSCYTGPMGTQGVGPCTAGTQTCAGGQWGNCNGQVVPGTEICDAIDQDCDNNVNEGSCSLPNAISSCSSASCTITSCNPGFSHCDASQTNGCETQHTGWSNGAPGEDLGDWDADAVYGTLCTGGGSCQGPIVTRTGTQGRFFTIDAVEGSGCCAYVSMRFELLVPPGADYDLFVSGSGCFADPGWQSINGTGQTESIVVWCNDDCAGANNSFTTNVEVRHYSGASCSPWTLNVYRRQC